MNTTSTTERSRRKGSGGHSASELARRERRLAVAFLLPTLVLVGGLIYLPMGRVVWNSLTETSEFGPARNFVGLRRYVELAGDPTFWLVVRNSLLWTAGVVIAQNLLGLGAAVLLNRPLPLRRLTRSALLVPWVLPGVVAALVWRFMYDPQLGLFNALLRAAGIISTNVTWLADSSTAMAALIVAGVWKGFPFSMVIYLAALQGVPRDQLDAARVDGATAGQRFRWVTLPSIAGIVRLNLLLTTVFTFNYFDMVWVATRGGPRGATHIFPTYIFQLGFGEFRFAAASTYGVVAALVLAAVGYLYIRELRPEETLN